MEVIPYPYFVIRDTPTDQQTQRMENRGNVETTLRLLYLLKCFLFVCLFVYFVSELESLEACYWLKAAGFPQYAQSYEGLLPIPRLLFLRTVNVFAASIILFAPSDGGFPIDIASVIKEHDFLDQDSIQSLHR